MDSAPRMEETSERIAEVQERERKMTAVRELFDGLDNDGDGQLSKQEVLTAIESKSRGTLPTMI